MKLIVLTETHSNYSQTPPLDKIFVCGIIKLAKTTHPDSRKGARWGFCFWKYYGY